MRYLYYPGCSLEGSAREYDIATRALMDTLGAELVDIEDWTCCGASAAASVSALLTLALPARILALAEAQNGPHTLLVPCSACYLNLKTVEQKIRSDAQLCAQLNTILAAEGLNLKGSIQVRHLLDILANDLGPAAILAHLEQNLEGLQIAPYYGCQCLRPYAVFDDPEEPASMTGLIQATGADVYPWAMGTKCCGAAHMQTKMDVGLALSGAILKAAHSADAVVTVCPMCQINLEAYQKKVARQTQTDVAATVLYLPQLLGLAVGLSADRLRLDLNLAVQDDFREKIGHAEHLPVD